MTTMVTIHSPKSNEHNNMTVKVTEENYSTNEDKWKWGGAGTLIPGETRHYHVWKEHRLTIEEILPNISVANTHT